MYFYALFAAALLLSRRFAPLICSAFLTLIVIAIALSGTENESLKFYASPIVFEFVFGIIVYYAVTALDRRADDFREVGWLKWLLFASTLTASLWLVAQGIYAGFGLPRYISSGVPSLIIVLAAILIERIYRTHVKNKLVFALGEASYILYLIHPYIIYGALRLVVGRATDLRPSTIGLLVSALLVLCSVIAIGIHLWFEKPLMNKLRRTLIPAAEQAERRTSVPLVLDPGNARYNGLCPPKSTAFSDLTKGC